MKKQMVTVVTDQQNRLVRAGEIKEGRAIAGYIKKGYLIRNVTLARFKQMKFKWQTEDSIKTRFNDPETPF